MPVTPTVTQTDSASTLDEPVLAVEGLHVARGSNAVLRDVNLTVLPGEAVGLQGGNGSGKTTLLGASIGLIPHQAGDIRLFGAPLARFKDWGRIGYVPQRDHGVAATATVEEIVAMGLLSERRLFARMSSDQKDRVSQALERVNIAHLARRPLQTLSGGQSQRVLIARALVGRCDLLLLDEPLAALDVHAQEDLAALLISLNQQGMTMLLVLHELGPLAPLLSRRIKLVDGQIHDEHEVTG